jgi:hypothetical protein
MDVAAAERRLPRHPDHRGAAPEALPRGVWVNNIETGRMVAFVNFEERRAIK